jgi:hypothetical protein
MWPDALTEPLRGKTSLWKVIWIYGFAASAIYTLLGWIFAPETPFGITIYFLFGLALGILQSVMLWQCAYNSRFPAAGRLLRGVVVVGLLTVPLMLYVLFRHPEALVPPG